MKKVWSIVGVVLVSLAATQPGGCSAQQKNVPQTDSGAVTKLADAAQDIKRDAASIIDDANSIKKEAQQADESIDKAYSDPATSPKAKEDLDVTIDSINQIKSHSDQVIEAGGRIEPRQPR